MKRKTFAMMLPVLFLVVFSVYSGNGGVQVSAVTVDCGDSNKEANILESGGSARIWLNVPAGTNTDGISYTITDNAKPVVNATTFSVTACGDGYFYGDVTLPKIEGSFTLNVLQSDGASMGSDSFRVQ